MKLKYTIFHYTISHILVHIVLALSIALFFRLNILGFLLAGAATALPDLDHLQLWLEHGIRGYLELRTGKELGKPRRYALHKAYVLAVASILDAIFSNYGFLFFTVIFTAVALHLLYDLFEDVVIFKTGIKHWM